MKRQLLGIAAVIGAAALASLFTARRIEAQYSSPVKVVNTTSGPALNSSVDDQGESRISRKATRPRQMAPTHRAAFSLLPLCRRDTAWYWSASRERSSL